MDFHRYDDVLKGAYRMEPTPIEDPDARQVYDAARGRDPWIQYRGGEEEHRKLWHAKMAHDQAMLGAIETLHDQETVKRVGTRIGYWTLGVLVALLLMIPTQCSPERTVIDDPDHYSRRH